MDLKILYWNVQGCGDSRFLPAAKQFLRDNRPDVVVFMEPRIHGKKADFVISLLGFPNSHRVEAAGFVGGIWVAWYDIVSVSIVVTHFQFIHFRITNKRDSSSLLATTVYASPSASGRKRLWPHLCRLASSIRSPWVMFGDFNATLSSADRKGCSPSTKPNKAFQNLLLDNGLRDMGFHGPEFTWSRGLAAVRLDRFICNSYFDEAYPVAMVHHLLHNWSPGTSMTETIRSFIAAADTWNKTVFGYLGTKKRLVMSIAGYGVRNLGQIGYPKVTVTRDTFIAVLWLDANAIVSQPLNFLMGHGVMTNLNRKRRQYVFFKICLLTMSLFRSPFPPQEAFRLFQVSSCILLMWFHLRRRFTWPSWIWNH
ncbi:hypothetical protein V6N13_060764 [Hibiscus sabdariffa]